MLYVSTKLDTSTYCKYFCLDFKKGLSYFSLFQENGNELPQNPDTNWTVVECQHGWEYDKSEFVNTLVTEVTINQIRKTQFKFHLQLDLVCDQQWWPSTSTALFYVGSLIGNIVFGQIADRLVYTKPVELDLQMKGGCLKIPY